MKKYIESTRGVTFLGMLIIIVVLTLVIVFAIKLAPPYIHYFAVKDAMESLAEDPGIRSMSKIKLRDTFIRKLQVNYISDVPVDKLEIIKKDGKMVLAINYEVQVHLIGNIDAVIKFNEEALIE